MKENFLYLAGAGLTLLFSPTFEAQAQVCATPPSCESLGFTQKIDDCTTRRALKCPFDKTALFCGEEIYPLTVGDFLFSDMTTASKLIEGKTPIGVVFDIKNNYAVSLESNIQGYWQSNDSFVDIPGLTNCRNEQCDVDGKSNTQTLIAHGKENGISYAAAEYCNTYTTKGTTAGQWFLPSLAQLKILARNSKAVDNTLLYKIGEKARLTGGWHWTSNEYDANSAWFNSVLGDGGGNYTDKFRPDNYNKSIARPIIQF